MPGCGLPGQLHADDVRQAHPRSAAEHHVLGLEPADADCDHAERVDVRRVAVGADQRVGESDAVLRVDDRRHPLQVDLVHDAVAGRNHFDVLERPACPVDEVEAVLVAPVFHRAVLRERVLLEAAVFHRERMIHDQLHRHDGIHLGRIAAHVRDRIAQPGKIDERRLAEDVVAHDARREPGKVEVATALDQLRQRRRERGGIAAANEILREHSRGVRQLVVRATLDRVDRGTRVEIVECRSRQALAVGGVHGPQARLPIGTNVWSSGPV